MLWLWITLGVLAAIGGLLCCPMQLRIGYRETLQAELRWLFLRFRLTDRPPKKEKPKKAAKRPSAPPPKKSWREQLREFEESLGASSLPDAVGRLTELLRELMRRTAWFVRRSTLARLELTVTVGGADAADAALTYGGLCAAVYPLVSWATAQFRRVRRQQVEIRCDFDSTAVTAVAEVWVSVTPWRSLWAAWGLLWTFIKKQTKPEEETQ